MTVAVLLLLTLVTGCDYGPRVYDCLPSQVTEARHAFNIVVEAYPSLAETVSHMDVLCRTRSDMQYDADAYTLGIGSSAARGRMVVAEGVPVGYAVLHEAMHWSLWYGPDRACSTHRPECGWDAIELEVLNRRLGMRLGSP